MYYVTNREVLALAACLFLLFYFHLFGLEQSSARVHATVYYPQTSSLSHYRKNGTYFATSNFVILIVD